MNKFKNILLIGLVLFLASACTPAEDKKENEKNVNGTQIASEYLTDFDVLRYKVSEYEMPAFTLKVSGTIDKTVNSNSLSSLKMYDFVTFKADYSTYGLTKNGAEERYSGIRMVDVLNYLGVDSYSELTLLDFEGGEITLPSNKIDEDCYLVFYHNGEKIGDGKFDFVIPGFVDIFWGKGISNITITK